MPFHLDPPSPTPRFKSSTASPPFPILLSHTLLSWVQKWVQTHFLPFQPLFLASPLHLHLPELESLLLCSRSERRRPAWPPCQPGGGIFSARRWKRKENINGKRKKS